MVYGSEAHGAMQQPHRKSLSLSLSLSLSRSQIQQQSGMGLTLCSACALHAFPAPDEKQHGWGPRAH